MSRSFSSETLFETALAPRDARPVRPVPLSRRLVVAVVALGLGLGAGLAAPARADGRDAVTAIAALAAVALIASQMGRAEEKKDKDKPKPAPVVKPRLPATCAIDIDSTEGQPARVFAESCLRERGFGYRLPPDCARDVRLFGKPDRIYPSPCLQKAGFDTGSGPF